MAKPKTVRQSLGEIIAGVFDEDYLRNLASDVREMRKGYWGEGECPECGSKKKVKVELPDLTGQLKNLIELLEQAEGRPGTASGEPGGVTIIVVRPEGNADARNQDPPDLPAAA